MSMKLDQYFKNRKFYVWKESFAIVKLKKPLPNAFAVIKDKNEITCVIEQSKIKDRKSIIKIENSWRIITFDTILPFGLVGFIAKISKALAEEGISIFIISAFSADHILIKNQNLKKTINKLENLGFKI
jgi:hypothetical protein